MEIHLITGGTDISLRGVLQGMEGEPESNHGFTAASETGLIDSNPNTITTCNIFMADNLVRGVGVTPCYPYK